MNIEKKLVKKIQKDPVYDLWWALASEPASIRSVATFMKAGSARRLFEMEASQLQEEFGLSPKAAGHIIYRRNCWDHEKALGDLNKHGIRFIPYYDPLYPKRLLQTQGYPFALFVAGDLPDEMRPAVALIGARECSEYGRQMAEYFGEGLAKAGVDVISGMAFGIDGIGQRAALLAGGRSYGVLGNGPNVCYPSANRKLFRMLREQGGLLSEYGPDVPAVAWHFPARNRILAALSDLVLVVEAKEKSGTLITVDMALDAGRDVMVVPGRITDPLSIGCNRLWKTGASVACSVEDVLEMLKTNGFSCAIAEDEAQGFEGSQGWLKNKIHLERDEKLVYSCLDLYARSAEEVLLSTKLPYQELLRLLTELEFKGVIREVGKGYYIRTATPDQCNG